MENPFELILEKIKESEQRIAAILKQTVEYYPEIELDWNIPLKTVAEKFGVTSKTLSLHKDKISYTKRWGKFIF